MGTPMARNLDDRTGSEWIDRSAARPAPAHPKLAATLLMVGVVILLIAAGAMSTF